MKKGIKRRLVWSYLLLILFTVILFETIILSALIYYYQEGVKQALRDQGAMFASFYEQELMEGSFSENAEEFLYQYQFLVDAHVQLINMNGKIVAETHQSTNGNMLYFEDVQSSLNGSVAFLTSNLDGEKVMSVSFPLESGGTSVGAIRLTTSLEPMGEVYLKNTVLLLSIGGIVIIVAAILSFFLANTITKPVSQITQAAEQMASGEFSTRIHTKKDDEIGKLAETLNYMARQVQEHEKVKNTFIASVSHDLRTPLTSIKGWAVTFHSLTEDEFHREGLEIISNESDRLNALVTDLLDLSSLSSGKLSFMFHDVKIGALIQEVVHQLQPRAEEKGVQLEAEISVDIGVMKADGNRLKQALINLADNALKFTAPGGKILLKLKEEAHDAVILVADSGKGIPDDEINSVRNSFYKGKSKGAGTGLGLAICEEIVKGHHGQFSLTSKEGVGTTAEIRLPL
ncbi:PhoR family transcriptional regulator [Mesobacillus campisalis]|uniref:histidine kinase n=1 Tax=Mesobacillus campisalis TaxID=1408103 RepID=A0A0M2SH15_9BACI|nr:HAMP domain-containing sensor histidine kinase [Mesobacillus campisalis]KKK33588.1 PhoR family transcriptional regulator [Mesobacillus campisalis]